MASTRDRWRGGEDEREEDTTVLASVRQGQAGDGTRPSCYNGSAPLGARYVVFGNTLTHTDTHLILKGQVR